MREARKRMLVYAVFVLLMAVVSGGPVGAHGHIPRKHPQVVYVDALHGDDNNSGELPDQALASIGEGVSSGADQVFIYPGVYREHLELGNKSIELLGVVGPEGAPVIEGGNAPAITWEGNWSINPNKRDLLIVRNLVIRRCPVGILILGGFPKLKNLTIVECELGVMRVPVPGHDTYIIEESILWNNRFGDIIGGQASYSCLEHPRLIEGAGVIVLDPKFADAAGGDYRLRSRVGRYHPDLDQWLPDDEMSPCIDTGRPIKDVGEEPDPNGLRINMGAFGGTAYASMSEGWRPEIDITEPSRLRPEVIPLEENNEWEITVVVEALFGDIAKVNFQMDNVIVAVDDDGADGWQATWMGEGTGQFVVVAVAEDTKGIVGVSGPRTIQVVPPNGNTRSR